MEGRDNVTPSALWRSTGSQGPRPCSREGARGDDAYYSKIYNIWSYVFGAPSIYPFQRSQMSEIEEKLAVTLLKKAKN